MQRVATGCREMLFGVTLMVLELKFIGREIIGEMFYSGYPIPKHSPFCERIMRYSTVGLTLKGGE